MADAGYDLVGGMRRAAGAQAASSKRPPQDGTWTRRWQGSTPGERRELLDAATSQGLRELDSAMPEPPAKRAASGRPSSARRRLRSRGDSEAAKRL